jgi:hypothetical protein
MQAAPMIMTPVPPPPPPTDSLSLRARYGPPDFIRRENDSELWRYNGMSCTAFFFLYREGEMWLIRYAETAPRGQNMPADPVCIQSISARPPMQPPLIPMTAMPPVPMQAVPMPAMP